MKRYDERILKLLLDRYEGSLLYEGRNQVNITIAVKLTKSIVPEYFDQTGTEYTIIDEQLTALERTGLIRLVWGKNNKHIIERCELNTDEAARAYAMLKRIPKHDKEEILKAKLSDIRTGSSSDTVNAYISYIEDRLKNGRSLKSELDIDNIEGLEQSLQLVNAIELNTDECFVRELSIRTFRDSKTAEQYMSKAVGILRRFSAYIRGLAAAEDMSEEDILAEYSIFRNPSWVMLKGSGRLKIGDSIAALEVLPLGFGIAGADTDRIVWDAEAAPRRILTIENLTSFHRWRDRNGDTICIYLGGFANRYRRALIRQLKTSYPDAEYVHFGDIDCGGFNIWKALCQETGIDFALAGMDEDTYLAHCAEGRPLTENDRRTLTRMKEDSFFAAQHGLFDLMLEKGLKTEQECVEID